MRFRDLIQLFLLIVLLQSGLGFMMVVLSGGIAGVDISSLLYSLLLLIFVSSLIGVGLYWLVNRYTRERVVKTAMMAMSDDEKVVLREIMNKGELRQDTLRRNLDFSKSKLSALVNNLYEKNAVEKVRYKRTNLLRPTEEFRI